MLDEATKASIRRHLGVPAVGLVQDGFELAIRTYDFTESYFSQVGLLESRMLALSADEESTLTGQPIAEVRIFGAPSAGDSIGLTITQTNANGAAAPTTTSIGVQGVDLLSPDVLYAIATRIATAINAANLGVTAASIPSRPMLTAQMPTYAVVQLVGPVDVSFAVAFATTGGTLALVQTQGNACPVQRSFNGTVVAGYVPICDYLESQIAGSGDYASFEKADVVTFRDDELGARVRLYNWYRKRISDTFGVAVYPLGNPRRTSSRNRITI